MFISQYRFVRWRVFFLAVQQRLDAGNYARLVVGLLWRCLRGGLWALLIPIGLAFHILGFRRLIVRSEHIGHLAIEPDSFFKEVSLGLLPKRKWFMTVPASRNSNPHMLRYWRAFVPIIANPLACGVLETVARYGVACRDLDQYMATFFGTQDAYRVARLWGTRPPLLSLDMEDEAWGRLALAEIGIPEGKWFVCVHVREGGFLPRNEAIQSHRNASIDHVIPAMREVLKRGGVCVRMGDGTMSPLPQMHGVIDYAHSPLKSPRMDVILCAKARLFLGCTSGLAFLSAIFGVPIAHANMIPVATLGLHVQDISIPKLIFSEREARYLPFSEILGTAIGDFFFSHQYTEAGLRVEENSPEDIQLLLGEALDRIDGRAVYDHADRVRQQRYLALFRPGHYSYGAPSRVGRDFLRRHEELLVSHQQIAGATV